MTLFGAILLLVQEFTVRLSAASYASAFLLLLQLFVASYVGALPASAVAIRHLLRRRLPTPAAAIRRFLRQHLPAPAASIRRLLCRRLPALATAIRRRLPTIFSSDQVPVLPIDRFLTLLRRPSS